MATYQSKAYVGGVPFRPTEEGVFTVTSSILIPNGTALALNDVFKFFKIGADVRVLELTLLVDDLDTGTSAVLDVGYSAAVAADVPDFFLDGSTIGQTGGSATVTNGGTPAFADGAFVGVSEVLDIEAKMQVAPAGSPTTDRYLTLVMKACAETTAIEGVPYVYADRYDADGVSSV